MMYFESVAEVIEMGGHGRYVWVAYGAALAVFVFNVAAPLIRRRRVLVEQARQLRREELRASGS